MNRDFTEQWNQWMRQMDWLTGTLRQRALVYAELPVKEKFPRHCHHSHRARRAMQHRQAQWRSRQHPFD